MQLQTLQLPKQGSLPVNECHKVFLPQVQDSFHSDHESGADEDRADEPHVSQVGEHVAARLVQRENRDDGADREEDDGQREVAVRRAVAGAEDAHFLQLDPSGSN